MQNMSCNQDWTLKARFDIQDFGIVEADLGVAKAIAKVFTKGSEKPIARFRLGVSSIKPSIGRNAKQFVIGPYYLHQS
jgi:hypothetical protein